VLAQPAERGGDLGLDGRAGAGLLDELAALDDAHGSDHHRPALELVGEEAAPGGVSDPHRVREGAGLLGGGLGEDRRHLPDKYAAVVAGHLHQLLEHALVDRIGIHLRLSC
jgi:hypothetical protein